MRSILWDTSAESDEIYDGIKHPDIVRTFFGTLSGDCWVPWIEIFITNFVRRDGSVGDLTGVIGVLQNVIQKSTGNHDPCQDFQTFGDL